ncbi:inosine/xanthosine triphosphatase [Aestuariibacter sp. AA17]|uniref:Inosine/xanthosine triphosphatase n=1 Tax=Fluctibacter corallii TaxID=2984329 RepID=A0ABT3A424_9ALTE|nr:inosine/xanthosine triphosphatase [Aestuariibacter sp. AA17]MCV2883370.1 inosine/xanthosine triphosphatase [Aestuariibacter sp. AA17]
MNPLRIIVGSTNPVKINAAKEAFSSVYPEREVICEGVKSPSGVPDQPMNSHDTLLGAQNRVSYLVKHHDADFYTAMEGGVDRFDYGSSTFAYVVISDGDVTTVGRSANLPIPEHVFNRLDEGKELGTLMDEAFGTHNVKQQGGAIGLLTNGVQTRTSAYTQALTMAMGRFLHPAFFAGEER